MRDESTDVVRVVVEMKRDASADAVMAYLFKHTSLQINFNVNLTALVPTGRAGVGQPARLTLLELCRHFLDFRRDVVRRRLTHELGELRARLHILAGFLKLFDGVDRAIKIIRQAASRADAQQALMKAFALDEVQADAILETRLYQLARLEIDKIRAEQREKQTRAGGDRAPAEERQGALEAGLERAAEVAKKYGDARRTRAQGRRRAGLRRRGLRRARGHHRGGDPRRLAEAGRRDQGPEHARACARATRRAGSCAATPATRWRCSPTSASPT